MSKQPGKRINRVKGIYERYNQLTETEEILPEEEDLDPISVTGIIDPSIFGSSPITVSGWF
jgi:hypothetical protein